MLEDRLAADRAVHDQPDASGALAHEQAIGVARDGGDRDRLVPRRAAGAASGPSRACPAPRPRSAGEPRAGEVGDVQAAGGVLAERREVGDGLAGGRSRRGRRGRGPANGSRPRRSPRTARARRARSARCRARRTPAVTALPGRIVEERLDVGRRGRGAARVRRLDRSRRLALAAGPAEVRPARLAEPIQSISSRAAGADVADQQCPGLAVEGEAPGVAQPVGVHLRRRARPWPRTGCRAGPGR